MNRPRAIEQLDAVLTLRGHQITLRQALAEGLIKGQGDREARPPGTTPAAEGRRPTDGGCRDGGAGAS